MSDEHQGPSVRLTCEVCRVEYLAYTPWQRACGMRCAARLRARELAQEKQP